MKLALDTVSKRHKDENGFLHVSISNISKENVSGYYGYEIPNYAEFGLDPDKIYYAYRKGEELEKGASTFNGLPLLSDHYIEHATNPQKEFRIGSLGTNAKFIAPYLQNSLIITDQEAIEKIESKECVELSCAYMYTPVFEKGNFEGQDYDFIMTNIRGNHVALVSQGRAGSDVFVADTMPNKPIGVDTMTKINKDNDTEQYTENQESLENEENDFVENTENSDFNDEKLVFAQFQKELLENLPQYVHSIKMLNQLLQTLICLDKESLDPSEKDEEESKNNTKTAMDRALYKEAIKKETLEELRAIDKAISHCQPLVGQLDPFAFDKAQDVYLKACNLLDYTANTKSAKDVVLALAKSSNLHENSTSQGNESETTHFMSRFQ